MKQAVYIFILRPGGIVETLTGYITDLYKPRGDSSEHPRWRPTDFYLTEEG